MKDVIEALQRAKAHIESLTGSALLAGERCGKADAGILRNEACLALCEVSCALDDIDAAIAAAVELYKRDAERLDWIDTQNKAARVYWKLATRFNTLLSVMAIAKPAGDLPTIREVIDAAITSQKEQT